MWRDVTEGLRASTTHPVLRALLGAGVTINFFAMAYTAVYMLYMVNTLGIPRGSSAPSSPSAASAGSRRLVTTRPPNATARTVCSSSPCSSFPIEILAVGLLNGPLWWKLALLTLTGIVTGGVVVAFATCMGAIILRETAPELRGRVNATMTFAVQGVMALGGLAGGVLAEFAGLRPVILISAAGIALSTIWIWTSPLRPGRRRRRFADPTTPASTQPSPEPSRPSALPDENTSSSAIH